ncbi:hypothetical protein FRB93_006591 [Tulasnella sp. JGI-2019a]|nr:hypothetical protein FRB93_006591 [Tulasnella sp. JGI-2019a]
MPNNIMNPGHTVLFVDELILKFLTYLHVPTANTDYADINAAGLTCKAWREPSLGVKWREVYLKDLLSVLVPLTTPPRGSFGCGADWFFSRNPTASDHARFHAVARRVRFIKGFGDLHLRDTVFETIFRGFPESKVLLPNLEAVREGPVPADVALRFLSLFPSSLKNLTLFISITPPETHIALIHSLTSRLSQLSTIKMGLGVLSPPVESVIAALLEQNANLRDVTILHRVTTSTIMEALSKLPDLESLHMGPGTLGEACGIRTHIRRDTITFPRLKTFTSRLTLDTAVPLLSNIAADHSLDTLELMPISDGFQQADLEFVLSGVVKHTLLRHLAFRHMVTNILQVNTLQKLAICSLLESLEIDVMAESTADPWAMDEGTGGLLEHLPRLTSLILRLFDRKSAPLLTLHTLALAITHCPLLQRASLFVDATTPIAVVPDPLKGRANRPRVLAFSYAVIGLESPIDAPETVASVLTHLSPEVEIRIEKSGEGWSRWDEVESLMSNARGGA